MASVKRRYARSNCIKYKMCNAEKCREMQRNEEKCKDIQRSLEKCREKQRNAEKFIDMQRNAEKCCEMQRNATFSFCGYFCRRVNIWKVSLDV